MVGAVVYSGTNETEVVKRRKREREAIGLSAARKPQVVEHLWPDFCATMTTVKTGRGGQ